MDDQSDAYHTYVLRVWRAQYRGHWQWHASLENPHTSERMVFATLDALCRYLESRRGLLEISREAETETFPSIAGH